jgi:hypothetical protein
VVILDIRLPVKILDIIYRPVFYLKLNVSLTGFCPRLLVEPTQLSSIDRATLCLRAQMETTPTYWAELSRFHLKTETESSHWNIVFDVKDGTIDNVQNLSDYIDIRSSQTFRSVFLLGSPRLSVHIKYGMNFRIGDVSVFVTLRNQQPAHCRGICTCFCAHDGHDSLNDEYCRLGWRRTVWYMFGGMDYFRLQVPRVPKTQLFISTAL